MYVKTHPPQGNWVNIMAYDDHYEYLDEEGSFHSSQQYATGKSQASKQSLHPHDKRPQEAMHPLRFML